MFDNKYQYESYLKLNGYTQREIDNMVIIPCNCGFSECQGYKIFHPFEQKAIQNHIEMYNENHYRKTRGHE